MIRKILSLDPVHLSHPDNNWKLTVAVNLQLTLPDIFADQNDDYIHDALTSGTIWPVRGAFFAMDFHLVLDRVAESLAPKHVAESLGYRLRDADLWSRLSLLPVLEFPRHGGGMDNTTPNLSLCIKHKVPIQSSVLKPKFRDTGTHDINPPDGVSCAPIERLQIYLNIETTTNRRQSAEIPKKSGKQKCRPSEMLQQRVTSSKDTHLQSFEKVVRTLSGNLSKSISQCFLSPNTNLTAHKSDPVDQISNTVRCHEGRDHFEEMLLFPSDSFLVHVGDQPEDDMLLTSDLSDTSKHQADELDTDMLLRPDLAVPHRNLIQLCEGLNSSQATNQSPSLDSHSTILDHSFVSFPQTPEQPSLKSRLSDIPSFPQSTNGVSNVNNLVEAALIVLVLGSNSRCRPTALKSLRVKQPPPKASLAELAPTIFSPDFREAIANNARFLPTISCTISASWPRNVQSPTLRRKILGLSKVGCRWSQVGEDSIQDRHNPEGLANAVQSILWSMMRRKLFRISAMHSLFRKSDTRSVEIHESQVYEDKDLLEPYSVGEMVNPGDIGTEYDPIIKEGDKDEVRDFNDLLAGNICDDGGGDLLAFFDDVERERIQTEQETEEMLFGDAWGHASGHDSDFDMLLDPGVEEDFMLIDD
ncbi:hypothetical protein BJ875DRAFT_547584 [Amylocarpus encephaloides]|uniref:Uncharacterized protein n=1 Tax=Amylocarpus encephaloides TaxID=45428 RepID=A0A9P7Y8Z6_9HELO|nr:hypothetical protein BJ875DRAFT_547584 [Amylocarpus encephaloides]